jgi:hypothetical protein
MTPLIEPSAAAATAVAPKVRWSAARPHSGDAMISGVLACSHPIEEENE